MSRGWAVTKLAKKGGKELRTKQSNCGEREEWKPVPGYEGLYEVSNMGRVKSLCAGRWKTTMMRKPVPDKNGYQTVNLKKNGKYVNVKIHRLVAEAFIANPNNLPMVNHIDENKANNLHTNLEWCDAKYNNNYGSKPSKFMKRIAMLSKDGKLIRVFDSINDAASFCGVSPSTISTAASERRGPFASGYRWQKV